MTKDGPGAIRRCHVRRRQVPNICFPANKRRRCLPLFDISILSRLSGGGASSSSHTTVIKRWLSLSGRVCNAARYSILPSFLSKIFRKAVSSESKARVSMGPLKSSLKPRISNQTRPFCMQSGMALTLSNKPTRNEISRIKTGHLKTRSTKQCS